MTSFPASGPDQQQLKRLLSDLRGLVLLHRELGIDAYPASPGLQRLLTPAGDQPTANGAQPSAKDTHYRTSQTADQLSGPPRHPRLATQAGRNQRAGQPEQGQPAEQARHAERAERGEQAKQDAAPDLDALAAQAAECRRCPRHQGRQRVIFGQGSTTTRLMLITAGCGPEEERLGLPCQGEAGALLDRMLAAINLDRQQIYLTTLAKCVPAAGETAPAAATAARECLPFLQHQIAAVNPALICTLGPLPAQLLLKTDKNLLQLRGRFHRYHQIPLMPTLDPDFLRHNPEMKKAAWQDLQIIQKFLQKNKQKQPAR